MPPPSTLHLPLSTFTIHSTWLKDAACPKTLLVAFAHPDDESFGPGGILAKYSAEGVNVHYACATRGEAGEVEPERLQGYASLGDLRWHEVECAARLLGLSGLHYLGYRDSGMSGSPDNFHPNALCQADAAEVTSKLVALIRALRPQVMLTFDPHGGYGHPDHVAIHRAATQAFWAAADATRYPEQITAGLRPYAPQKLYYTAFPTTALKAIVLAMRLMGKDPTRFGRNQDINLAELAARRTLVTTRVDITPYLQIREQARACHQSQGGGSGGILAWIPYPIRRTLLGLNTESFTRVYPPADRRTEKDLFEGVNLDATWT